MSTDDLLAEIEPLLGRASPPVVSTIEAGAVARFAEAVGEPIDDDDGGLLVPPTFLCSLRYRRPPMPRDAEDRMVIVDNALTLARLPVVGERLTATASFTRAWQRGPFVVLELACRYTDDHAAEVAVFTCSWLLDPERPAPVAAPILRRARDERVARSEEADVDGHGGPDPRPARAWPAIDPRALRVGDEIRPLAKAPLGTRQLVQWAGASRDYNPIHYDAHHAAKLGFSDVIAPGLLKMAILGEHVTLWSHRWGRLRRLEARYRGVDLPGARLTARATVAAVELRADRGPLVTLRLSLADEDGEEKTVGSALVETI